MRQSFRQCSSFITLCLGSIGMGCVISELCYKVTILQRNYWKMDILWSFSYNFFVKFCAERFWCHIMFLFYQNLCYIKVCYKGTALNGN